MTRITVVAVTMASLFFLQGRGFAQDMESSVQTPLPDTNQMAEKLTDAEMSRMPTADAIPAPVDMTSTKAADREAALWSETSSAPVKHKHKLKVASRLHRRHRRFGGHHGIAMTLPPKRMVASHHPHRHHHKKNRKFANSSTRRHSRRIASQ